MSSHYDVCIRGAGIVGQTLALLLARERLRVALVQPAGPQRTGADVRAYALNAASRSLIESVRAWPPEHQATAVRRMQVQSDQAAEVLFDADELGVPALTWIVDVPALEDLLQQAVGFQALIDRVQAPTPAALTVICEGKASISRTELGVGFERVPYGQHALATRVQCERAHGQVAYQWFDDGNILAFLPLAGTLGNSVAVVWSVTPEQADTLMNLAPEAFCAQLQAASHGTLGALALQGERAVWPLTQAHSQRWVGPLGGSGMQAFALAGDAAHAVHPLAGQGLNLGLSDVAELVRQVQAKEYWRSLGDLRWLRRYERARQAEVKAAGAAMDGLQQVFTRSDAALPKLRQWGMQIFEHSGPFKRWVAQRAMGIHS